MPYISIIVPVYNASTYLARTVKSVQQQIFSDWELLLIDDGSTDGTGALCDALAAEESRIRVVHKKNAGTSAARNTGICSACGEYIAFMDDDDYALSNWLQAMAAAAQKTGVDLVHSGCICVAEDSAIQSPPQTLEELPQNRLTVQLPDELIGADAFWDRLATTDDCNAVWTQLCRTEIQKQCLFPEGRLGEDIAVGLALSRRVNQVALISDCSYCWVQRAKSQSHRNMQLSVDMMQTYGDIIKVLQTLGECHTSAWQQCLVRKEEFFFYGPLSVLGITTMNKKTTQALWQQLQQDRKQFDYLPQLPKAMRVQYHFYRFCPWLYKCFVRVVAKMRKDKI